jgi:hypothetical protein
MPETYTVMPVPEKEERRRGYGPRRCFLSGVLWYDQFPGSLKEPTDLGFAMRGESLDI